MKTETFVNSEGKEFKVAGFPYLMLSKLRKQAEKDFKDKHGYIPKSVTYEIPLGSGEKETLEYDDKSIENATPELQAQYKRYKKDSEEIDMQYGFKMLDIAKSCIVLGETDETEFIEKLTAFGIELPTNKFEKLILYADMEIIKTQEDPGELLTAAMKASNVGDEEAIKSIRDSFRGKVEENTPGSPEAKEGSLGNQ